MMHQQSEWNSALEADVRRLTRWAVEEDLAREQDWTTLALVPDQATAVAHVVARAAGVMAGLDCGPVMLDEIDSPTAWDSLIPDGTAITAGTAVARLSGPARDLLTAERTILNFLGHLSGVATLTKQFTVAVADTNAVICDTRKTLPGWRRLQKYAVRCGGGVNHRGGLYDAILIKDNHLAFGASPDHDAHFDIGRAVQHTRQLFQAHHKTPQQLILEVEVDSLAQLRQALVAHPDIILLDNMSPDQMVAAVDLRNQLNPRVLLEASGGITLDNVGTVAATGVDRISIGALTHSAPNLDIGLDWSPDKTCTGR